MTFGWPTTVNDPNPKAKHPVVEKRIQRSHLGATNFLWDLASVTASLWVGGIFFTFSSPNFILKSLQVANELFSGAGIIITIYYYYYYFVF